MTGAKYGTWTAFPSILPTSGTERFTMGNNSELDPSSSSFLSKMTLGIVCQKTEGLAFDGVNTTVNGEIVEWLDMSASEQVVVTFE